LQFILVIPRLFFEVCLNFLTQVILFERNPKTIGVEKSQY
jgi:hypothetical protein